MKSAANFQVILGRFVRWFFTASPEAVVDPLPTPKPKSSGGKARRQDARLRALHAGRVDLSDRKRP